MNELTYTVPGMTYDHCKTAVTEEVTQVAGVASVAVDLDAKLADQADPKHRGAP